MQKNYLPKCMLQPALHWIFRVKSMNERKEIKINRTNPIDLDDLVGSKQIC